jgi:DNA-binding NarL/FixJ family response regulator
MTRVLIVDDHPFLRRALSDVVNASGDLQVVGECEDGVEVAAAVDALRPDVIVMDVRMEQMSGIEATESLTRRGAGVRVIILSSETGSHAQAAAREAGAVGYLPKGAPAPQLLEAIRRVARGATVWPADRSRDQAPERSSRVERAS